jgi:hypothetical protein
MDNICLALSEMDKTEETHFPHTLLHFLGKQERLHLCFDAGKIPSFECLTQEKSRFLLVGEWDE